MELRDFARLILSSAQLADKVWTPSELTDEGPGEPEPVPLVPARPQELRLDSSSDSRSKKHMPSPGSLHKAEARGHAIHFFANHELLAAELMAVCLLRFPHAPSSFRRGVARTLVEEQEHLRLYIQRMNELGVEFGDVPVGGHFWRTLSKMESPLHYVSGMSLLFEQANLDHAARWQRHFQACEDFQSASLMKKILEDEIRHVRLGHTWFERWRPPGDPFAIFTENLPEGLDPIRARGQGSEFETEARKQAGLSLDFIQALQAHRASRGRRPRFWIFWPDVEEHLRGCIQPSKIIEKLTTDMAPMLGFLGSDDDLVWAPQPPTSAFSQRLSAVGLPTPRCLSSIHEAKKMHPDEIRPWGWSPEVRRRLHPLQSSVRVPLSDRNDRQLLSKALVIEARASFLNEGWLDADLVGVSARSPDEVSNYLKAIGKPCVMKSYYSASGRHRRYAQHQINDLDRTWVQERCERDGGVVVEPWLHRRVDFSLVVHPRHKPILLRMFTDAKGAYRGHFLGAFDNTLSRELTEPMRAFPGGIPHLSRSLTATVKAITNLDTFGVDLLVEETTPGNYRLQPLVEINARHTMGHIALALKRQLQPGRVGLWWHVRRSDLAKAQLSNFEELAQLLPPEQIETLNFGHKRVSGGTLPCHDPSLAQTSLAVLGVGRTLQEALEQFGPLHPVIAGELSPRATRSTNASVER